MNALAKEEEADRDEKEGEEVDGGGGGGDAKANGGKHTLFCNKNVSKFNFLNRPRIDWFLPRSQVFERRGLRRGDPRLH